jgi:hypothetical protein
MLGPRGGVLPAAAFLERGANNQRTGSTQYSKPNGARISKEPLNTLPMQHVSASNRRVGSSPDADATE